MPSVKAIKAKGQDAQRLALLDIAIGLLEQEGATALSMRRIAQQAQCSTTILYTLFGGKEGLINALYLEGFRRLESVLRQINHTDPLWQIISLHQAYRFFALEQPLFYSIMFERPIPEFQIPQESRLQAWHSLLPLQTALNKAVEAQIIGPTNVQHLAMQLWMTTHGVVSLELAGYIPPDLADGATVLENLVKDCLQKLMPV
jgi:AcrR family transcriptional regulator